MTHYQSEQMAITAAEFLKRSWKIDSSNQPEVGLILGTGWGEVLEFDQSSRHPFAVIPGFNKIVHLEGHAREVVCGTLSGKRFVALRGRMHLNERPADPELYAAARLQVEMLVKLGVKKFILTCAAGSLVKSVGVGDIVLIDGFVTLFAPEMPLFAGEFCSPEDAIDLEWEKQIFNNDARNFPFKIASGGHVMVRGPFFEGRKYDKKFLASTGAAVVGMSVLPEACVASLYEGVKVLPLAFITNTAFEEHSHEENQRRAKEKAEHLGKFLGAIVERM
ncbi:purine-nucleoside phosphorylase [Candidatus Uhrbacteria bacterium]|nr:purine-nucleoside phosphorylase [Candidatus Uhrbacteria bacterium]